MADDPFATLFAPKKPVDPFGAIFSKPAQPTLDDIDGRIKANDESLQQTILKLRSIVPANEGHKARLDRLASSLEAQRLGQFASRGKLEEFIRGTTSGAASGLQFPIELAGDVAALAGHKDLQDYIEKNKRLIDEDTDHPRGGAAFAGELFGGVVASGPAAGGLAEGAGKTIVKALPNSRLAAMIAKGAAGGWKARAATNVITGLPVNAVMGLGGAEIDVPEGATPEEAQHIREMNIANKLKQLAIGIGADALFGAIPHRGKKPTGDTPLTAELKPTDVITEAPITAERQAQLDRVKAQNAVKVATKRRERIDKSLAQSEWQILNPDLEWKELKPDVKRRVYDDYSTRRRNTNSNTSTAGLPAAEQTQLASMEEQLKKIRGERDDAVRTSETDSKLEIGNDRALQKAAINADKDKGLVYIMADVNNLKGINDGLGLEAGDQLLKDMRDAMIAAHTSEGAKPRMFRWGGDELVSIVPKDKAQAILDQIHSQSIKQYGSHTGSLGGTIFETLGEATSSQGKAKLAAAKYEVKARQGIPGRTAEEQALIDAVRTRQSTEPAPIAPPKPEDTPAPFPPEVMHAIGEVSQAGGLQNPEAHEAFIKEINRIYADADLKPEQIGVELQALIEDFTPFRTEPPELPTGTLTAAVRTPEGKIVTGAHHGDATFKAGRNAASTDLEHGFTTRDGKFLNRQQALEFARKQGVPLDNEVDGKLGLTTENLFPDKVDTPPGDRISGAAVRMADGSIKTGTSHYDIASKIPQKELNSGKLEEGWVDNQGNFLSRKEGIALAKKSGQIDPDTHDLAFEDMKPDAQMQMVDEVRGGQLDQPASASSARATPTKQTFLESIEHKKPLETLTEKQLGKLDDKLTDALDSVDKQSPEYQVLQRDFDAIHEEIKSRNEVAPKEAPQTTRLPEGLQIRPDYSDMAIARVAGKPKEAPTTVIDKELVNLRNMSPRKMTDGQLELHLRDLENQRRNVTTHDEAESAQNRINKVLEERAFRDKAASGEVPKVPSSVIQSTAGFAFGFSQPVSKDAGEDEQKTDRITNALTWAGIAAGGAMALRMAMRAHAIRAGEHVAVPSDRWPGSDVADKKILNQADIEDKPKHWLERARGWYQGIVRRTYGMDRAVEAMGGSKLAASKNPAKLIAMFGRWVSQAEGALMDQPSYTDLAGNVVPLNAQPYRLIADMVDGDLKGLGKLMAARTSIEGEGLRKTPFDAVTADLIFRNAPEKYHKAADAMRQFDLAMSQVLENAGVLTPGTAARFSTEEFYAGLKRVFDPDGGPSKISRDPKTKKIIISPNPVKGRTNGHTGQVYNPAETTAAMVPQIYRAAELNNIKNRFVDLWEAAGKPDHILKQAERRKQTISVDQQLRIDALRQEVKGMTQADAESVVAAFDPKSLDPRSNIMTVYREGVLRSYKVDEHVSSAMSSLQPEELEGLWNIIGLPASIARKGIVLNPFFVAKQAFIDNWQATLNSQYGFRFGVDQFIGWYNTVAHSKEYQSFIAAGGGHSTLQSHEFANVKTALQAIKHGGGSPMNVAVKQLQEMKLIDAYKSLIVPVSESARVGEYLRARQHGATVLDGVYAAKHVTANFQQRGGFQVVRGLDRASLFLNPGIQGLDQAMFRAGINPFRAPEEGRKAAAAKYLSKAFISITLPSMYMWMANRDDQEITDLRKTDSGQKYWFMRSPIDNGKLGLKKGDIIKIPKPIVDGQIFGSSMEASLDKMYSDDPVAVNRAMTAMAKDISFNILPTMGVLYYGLQTNTNLGTGAPIVPEADKELSIEHQGEDKASWLSRVVSRRVAPIVPDGAPDLLKNTASPAGLDFIMQNVGGMLGQDGLTALTQAVDAEQKGYVPAKEEYPLVSRVFAAYPTANVEPIRSFYDRANDVQTVAATINHLVKEDPARLGTYMASNRNNYALVGLFAKSRQDIANYRRAVQDIKDAPGETLSSEDRRLYIKQYMTLMIETARRANMFAKEVDKVYK